MYQDPNDKKTQVTRRPKWQKDSNVKKTKNTHVTRTSKCPEHPCDEKTQLTRRPKWQKDQNDKKIQMTRRFK